MALLTILRAYQISGEVSTRPALGSFEMWSHWVRDALIWLGEADPCDTIEVIRAGNPERQKHEAVVLAWRDHFGLAVVVTVRDLIEAATLDPFALQRSSTSQRLYDALLAVAGDHRRHGTISNDRLGRWLSKVKRQIRKGTADRSSGNLGRLSALAAVVVKVGFEWVFSCRFLSGPLKLSFSSFRETSLRVWEKNN